MAGFNFRINPETRDYELDGSGSFVRDYTAQTPMLLQLLDERGAWWGNLQLGSRIKSRFRGRPPANPAEALRADITEALQPFVRSGRLRTFSVRVDNTSPLTASVTAVDGDSQPIELTVKPVG